MSERNSKGKANDAAPRRARPAPVPRGEFCPKCGRNAARIIGRSESFPVLYLRCDGCGQASVAPG